MFNDKQLKTLKVSKLKTKLKKLGIYDEYIQYDRVIDYSKLNPQQHYLFKRVLHGLKTVSYTHLTLPTILLV